MRKIASKGAGECTWPCALVCVRYCAKEQRRQHLLPFLLSLNAATAGLALSDFIFVFLAKDCHECYKLIDLFVSMYTFVYLFKLCT